MPTIADFYERVNAAWPEGAAQRVPTPEAAINAARRLYRFATGETWTGKVKLTSGNRYTWARDGVLYVNPDHKTTRHRGWGSLVHDLSHCVHHLRHPNDMPHCKRHARIERRCVTQVVKRGWLQ